MKVKISQAKGMVTKFIKAKLVPFIHGSPAIGKSAICHQIAKEYGLKVIDIRLAQCDPSDLNGFPKIDGHKATYVPMDTFPIEGDKVPEGYNGWLIFFDEMSSAKEAVQAASYKIILDRVVGQHHLHKNVVMVAAGNLDTDNAIVQPMSTALQSRMVHIELEVDVKEWVDWASSNDIDYRITSYLNFKPSNIYTFNPDHSDKTYASPRTWDFTNKILKESDIGEENTLAMLAGTLSEGVAREFVGFCKIFQDLPTIQQIMAAPKTLKIPSEPSILYALTGSIAHNVTKSNVTDLMEYVSRIPIEFQVVCLREMIRRNKEIMGTPAIQSWISKSASSLF